MSFKNVRYKLTSPRYRADLALRALKNERPDALLTPVATLDIPAYIVGGRRSTTMPQQHLAKKVVVDVSDHLFEPAEGKLFMNRFK